MNDSDLIDQLGGTADVAGLCEVTLSAVSQWRTEGIPKARLMYLRAVRPDLFLVDRGGLQKPAKKRTAWQRPHTPTATPKSAA